MLTRRIPITVLAALALAVPATALHAQEEEQQQAEPGTTIIDQLEAAGNYTTFLQAIQTAGLEETLRDPNVVYTVFAPTDEAFAKLPEGRLGELVADEAAARELVAIHIAPEGINTADLAEPRSVVTVQGSNIEIERTDMGVQIRAAAPAAEVTGGVEAPAAIVATITTSDVQASNGVVHGIDTVLIATGK
jgi:uncharacterized surface protein with fasciclin (FAS1) repeats